jgi:catalase
VPEELVPVTPLGKFILNRNTDDFFAETEQVAFSPANVVSGIDFSNDPYFKDAYLAIQTRICIV